MTQMGTRGEMLVSVNEVSVGIFSRAYCMSVARLSLNVTLRSKHNAKFPKSIHFEQVRLKLPEPPFSGNNDSELGMSVAGLLLTSRPKTKQHRVDPSTRNACGNMSGREARHNRKSSACHACNNSPKRVSLRVSLMKIRHPHGHHRRGLAPHPKPHRGCVPPRFLRSGHLQTIVGKVLALTGSLC